MKMQRRRALVDTVANLRIEDLYLDDEAMRVFERHVEGEISLEAFRVAIDEMNERRFGPVTREENSLAKG
jgi:hypothetical protein